MAVNLLNSFALYRRKDINKVKNNEQSSQITLIATAAFGLEAIAAREIKSLGYEVVETENGRVTFTGPVDAICRCNLWLRTAERVLLKVGEFQAKSFEELFEKTKALDWSRWIPKEGRFPVIGKSVKSQLSSVPDCQAIVKKAVVESLKQRYHKEWFEETDSEYRIEVALLKDRATLTIDTSGEGLHKRGYRKSTHQAPLKETLASALVQLSFWKPERVLIDPFCGSGTIPIEAALIGKNLAPGMNREFISESWPWIPAENWRQARRETHDVARYDEPIQIQGFDIDERSLRSARHYAQEAFLEDEIHFEKRDFRELRSRYHYGCVITNPPYGERMGEEAEVQQLYREFGKVLLGLETWSKYILTAYPDLETDFGKKADRRRKLYNGRIMCQYYQYQGPRPPRKKEKDDNGSGAE
ncbi:MAG: class I SAM-dependent RNA methyltransferase [Tindallia sp. MSAO_Bac2]|nr:MAG: class I SAM-dependent RNA methyltransferase [Tindallia sp. MSAO_Bac2]